MLTALRSHDFRLLWTSQSISVIGDALILITVGLFVTRLTGSSSDVGLILAAYAAPLMLLLPVGGVVADRFQRQRVMLACDVVRGLLHGLLAVLIAYHVVQIWHMMLIGLAFGTAEAFFRPAYTGLVPQTVPEEHIQSAQALGGFSREVAVFVSPALATALVVAGGGSAAFALDAATFMVSALALSCVQARPRASGTVARASVVRELADGWQAVRSRGWVWVTILSFSVSQLVALAPFFVLGVAVAQQVYGSITVYGFANTAFGVGTINGALLGSRWHPRRPLLAATLVAVPWPGSIITFALGVPVGLVYSCMVLAGLGLGLFGVLWETTLAQRIPTHLLSRVSAWEWMGWMAVLPLAYVVAGPVGTAFGSVPVLVAGGLLGVGVGALALLPPSTRALPQDAMPAAAVPMGLVGGSQNEAPPSPFADRVKESPTSAAVPTESRYGGR